MSLPGSAFHRVLVATLVAALFAFSSASEAQQPPRAGSPANGAKLFSGTIRFANGGPPCATCHTAAGLPFPNGGTLGPDLTTAYARFGPDAMQLLVETLFFPTMDTIFRGRLLTPAEQADVLAFLAQSSRAAAAPNILWIFAGAGILVTIGLFILAALLWRNRLVRVRYRLVAGTIGERRA